MFSSQNSQVSSDANYIEDVFSTWLYTGNGTSQTITNGIDLAGKGGLVWIKNRAVSNNAIFDTVRTRSKVIFTNTTAAEVTSGSTNDLTSFNNDGFSVGTTSNASVNTNAGIYASWTFREQPKFFDVQTFTYPLSGSITVNHSLGSTPGCIFVKATDGADNWYVYHRMMNNGTNPSNYYMLLNSTGAQVNNFASWITVGSTSITFPSGALNPGSNFVMYLFAHNAGGFGLTGTDNVISCGSYTGTGAAQDISLGYEPQWIMFKPVNLSGPHWLIFDNMRGWNNSIDDFYLAANLTSAETNFRTAISGDDLGEPTATGFKLRTTSGAVNASGEQYIYIAIRRGPMKVPTSGTSVFIPLALNNASDTKNTTGFPVDLQFQKYRAGLNGIAWFDRLRGLSSVPSSQSATTGLLLRSSSTAAEVSTDNLGTQYGNTSFNTGGANGGVDMIYWNLRRAPSFFDEVCYTGTGVTHTETHNLGVAPELIIVKRRASATASWAVYAAPLTASYVGFLDLTNAFQADNMWNSTAPTSTAFTVRAANAQVNASGSTYVAYLFATCAGVSKVGSYTGNGSSQTINCGFTSGARFVLIKATSAAGHWRVYDTARGIVAGNEPELFLNLTDAEQTVYDAIDTASSGFIVNSNGANVNDSGVTYIFLAIA